MKREIDTTESLAAWLTAPGPAVFQGLDLTAHSVAIAEAVLWNCSFLGCRMTPLLGAAAANAGCLVIPAWPELPFEAVPHRLYTDQDLYDRLDPADPERSYRQCRDYAIYTSFMDPASHTPLPADLDVALYRRLHDAAISDCLDEVLDPQRRLRTVAIMGGHKIKRTDPVYAAVANLARELSAGGYTIVTGGGPGLMEAGNLGAYTAGFTGSDDKLDAALERLAAAPEFNTSTWLSTAYEAKRGMGEPTDPAKGRNIGIPTWFYGHEPANLFATGIAKYFENSVREEGLLAIALAGVIFGPGAGGTTQEIFQDACQNYYRSYAKKSPMILYPADFWAPPPLHNRHDPTDRRKPAYELLEKLAIEGGFSDYILCTDDLSTVPRFLAQRPPV